jgi:hypothetical protein
MVQSPIMLYSEKMKELLYNTLKVYDYWSLFHSFNFDYENCVVPSVCLFAPMDIILESL